jgi:hypothetical protein
MYITFISNNATTFTKPLVWHSDQKQLDDSLLSQTPSKFLCPHEKQLVYNIESGLILSKFTVIPQAVPRVPYTQNYLFPAFPRVFQDSDQSHPHIAVDE